MNDVYLKDQMKNLFKNLWKNMPMDCVGRNPASALDWYLAN